jgi:hypothetical protein
MPRSDEKVKTVPEMIASRAAAGRADDVRAIAARIRTESIEELIRRIGFEQDPIRLWMAHLMLDRHDVPPCLRWPERDESEQLRFITWLADVLWFVKRRRSNHKLVFTRWRRLLQRPHDQAWHKTALWAFNMGHQVGYYHSRGLGLTEADRHPMMVMVTQQACSDRALLRRLPQYREKLLAYALDHPDRSGRHDADGIADRRAELFRLFLLAGRNQTRAVEYLKLLSGQRMTRQAFLQQLQIIEGVTGVGRTRAQKAGRQRKRAEPSSGRLGDPAGDFVVEEQ